MSVKVRTFIVTTKIFPTFIFFAEHIIRNHALLSLALSVLWYLWAPFIYVILSACEGSLGQYVGRLSQRLRDSSLRSE